MNSVHKILALVALAVLGAAAGAAVAGDTYVPNSNPAQGSGNAYPFGVSEIRYQLILTAAQLGNKAFTVTDVSFANSKSGVFAAKEFEVRMSHTTAAPSTTFAENLPQPVPVLEAADYRISMTPKVWIPLRLTCPFRYDGVDYLTIDIRFRGVSSVLGGSIKGDGEVVRVFNATSGAFNASTGYRDLAGFKIRITYADVTPSPATPSIGTTASLLLDSSADAGRIYVAASSFSPGKIPLGCWTIGLGLDSLLFLTAMNTAPAMFQNYQGLLDANGKAKAAVWIPPIPSLVGMSVHTAFLVLDEQHDFATVSEVGTFKMVK